MEKERSAHPAWAQINFSRISSNCANFYGSELEQDHYISMEIKSSEMERSLTDDYYYTKENIVKLRMSSGQFSELITSMNRGDGVCCTLEYVNGKKIQELEKPESRKEFIHRKFDDRMKEFSERLIKTQKRAKELTAKKTLSKADQHELNLAIEFLTQEIASNIPFFAKCFQETMDEVVFEAKTEVENAIQHKVNVLGLEALHNQNKLLKNE